MDFLGYQVDPTLLQGAQAFFTVVMIDLVLAGDNAVVIGLAAAGLPPKQRGKAILIGVIAATVLRILFALIATRLLLVVGLLLAGGILLLWVCWKMWRELQVPHDELQDEEAMTGVDIDGDGLIAGKAIVRKSLGAAVLQIVIADVSMSLDNVLAVAGAAHEHPWIMVFGLALSVLLMGIAATFIARLLNKHRWIAYIGLIIILYVALHMMWDGTHDVCLRGLPMMDDQVQLPPQVNDVCKFIGADPATIHAPAVAEPAAMPPPVVVDPGPLPAPPPAVDPATLPPPAAADPAAAPPPATAPAPTPVPAQ